MQYSIWKFNTLENFYVAMKTEDGYHRQKVSTMTPAEAKRYGRYLPLRGNWDQIKLEVMLFGLRYKFSDMNPTLKKKLLSTGDCTIEEGNNWGDIFWGVDNFTRAGDNHLGRLLMQVRKEIQSGK